MLSTERPDLISLIIAKFSEKERIERRRAAVAYPNTGVLMRFDKNDLAARTQCRRKAPAVG